MNGEYVFGLQLLRYRCEQALIYELGIRMWVAFLMRARNGSPILLVPDVKQLTEFHFPGFFSILWYDAGTYGTSVFSFRYAYMPSPMALPD
jgi:hypothetical protein